MSQKLAHDTPNVEKIIKSFTKRELEALEEYYRKKYELRLGRSTQSRKIGCLSDMHTGSIYAICTDDPDSSLGYRPNKIQTQFREQWYDTRDWFDKTNIIVLNGEPFNGPNIKQNGDENWTSKMDEQVRESYRLLRDFHNKLFIITKGSNYHVKRDNTNYEELLAERLNALPYRAYNLDERFQIRRGVSKVRIKKNNNIDEYKGPRIDVFVFFKINGVNFNFTHHLGYSARYYYRATALSAEMAQMEFDRGYYYPKDESMDVLGRGHVHYNVYIENPSSRGFTTPTWKLPDEHLFRHGMGGTRPHIGGCSLIVEQNGEVEYDKLIAKARFPRPYIPDLTTVSAWN